MKKGKRGRKKGGKNRQGLWRGSSKCACGVVKVDEFKVCGKCYLLLDNKLNQDYEKNVA